MQKKHKVTMYYQSEWLPGIKKIEVHLVDVGARKYAQYDNAPYCRYRPKRARKDRELQLAFQPWLVVVEGWGHPDFENWQAPRPGHVRGVVLQEMKYSMCDERWARDGDGFVEALKAAGVRVVADFRHTQGFNSYSAKVAL